MKARAAHEPVRHRFKLLAVALVVLAAFMLSAYVALWRESQSPPAASAPSVARLAPHGEPAGNPRAAASTALPTSRPSPASDRTFVQELERSLASAEAAVRTHAAEHLFPELLAKDMNEAARIAASVDDPVLRQRLVRDVAAAWARSDSPTTLAWAENLPEADDRELARVTALTVIALEHPEAAVLLRQQHPDTAAHDGELPNLVQRWAEKDIAAALHWADSLPPGEQRDLVTARAAFVLSQTSPSEAARLVLDRISSRDAQREALLSVINRWAQRDFPAASDWVSQLADVPLRLRAEEELRMVRRHANAEPN
jgi:hypothetical protein